MLIFACLSLCHQRPLKASSELQQKHVRNFDWEGGYRLKFSVRLSLLRVRTFPDTVSAVFFGVKAAGACIVPRTPSVLFVTNELRHLSSRTFGQALTFGSKSRVCF